ncbi:insoluble matrix shell protein 5-like [Haliotis rubra]|uniref:insoluble matrix shell protein 5-like n=1 Tax=Haliotis rubra TaxID=36100 RepID=UPI001EE55F34|nr:insoluble matrix shell protein 5-like [Haliotis rubra]
MICLLVLTFAYGALSATAPTYAPNLATGLKEAFDSIDADGNDILDVSEFRKIFADYDLNQDGRMELAEYMSTNNVTKAFAEKVFQPFDTDHDDDLQGAELNNVIPVLDTNGDGEVSRAEFVTEYTKIFAAQQTGPPVGK